MPFNIFLIFELVGTVAFAFSGAMVGLSRKMDIFGVVVLGIVTAVGGGVIRDIVLGLTPPATFRNPIYISVAIIVSIILFIPGVRRFLFKKQNAFDKAMLFMDSLGLGIFTAVGIEVAYLAEHRSVFLLVFVGMITGIGGGVLRDVLSGNTPYIFVKHFYASASLIGALVSIFLWNNLGQSAGIIGCAFVVTALRLLAAKFRWSLPKAENNF
ncbi:MAG: trimeric intracellular cation channel family protein [Oscillospiraceae bacterium]|nr:trimeric intracellular cation channel family protein [Oscillospiraceae bacterium]